MEYIRTHPADGPEPGPYLAPGAEQAVRGAQEAGPSRAGPRVRGGRRATPPHGLQHQRRRPARPGRGAPPPGADPVLESEQLLQVFFADSGTTSDTLATLDAARAWAVERNADNLTTARAYAEGRAPFPERAAQTMVVGRFLTEYYRLVAAWADWATDVVARWPEQPCDAEADPAGTLRRADWSSRGPDGLSR
ncbi:hypothetical protein [Streptomyces sp. T028]|uniref:hypothetical protein n=1 Tax=Streptomyces sp. T028 TaxID=3394379 RepID=UPI003A8C1043